MILLIPITLILFSWASWYVIEEYCIKANYFGALFDFMVFVLPFNVLVIVAAISYWLGSL